MSEADMMPRLCGGTFFALLKRSCGDNAKDVSLMQELMKIYRPSFTVHNSETFVSYTSKFKNCESVSNNALHLDDSKCIFEFNKNIREHYDKLRAEMSMLINSYILDDEDLILLIWSLLKIIQDDALIPSEAGFFIEDGITPKTKKELKDIQHISSPSFLLGVWHFIITNIPDNTVGKNTFDQWHSKTSLKAKAVFTSTYGTDYDFSVTITRDSHQDESNLNADNKTEFSTPSKKYLDTLRNTYSHAHSFLYNEPVDFYSVFVCNNIQHNGVSDSQTIKECTVASLTKISRNIIITGTGGLGKSMMLQHLLLTSLDNYEVSGKIPLLIPLKSFNPTHQSIISYFYFLYLSRNGEMSRDDFYYHLAKGDFIFLLDGLDEIKANYRSIFCSWLSDFCDQYYLNTYILSSRPYTSFWELHQFSVCELSPFTKHQAISLIKKLRFRPDEPSVKADFMQALEDRLFYTHKAFCENPLLLTIMLMTYDQFAEIPSKMHIFYREVYLTLSQRHDATKHLNRSFCTGLTAEELESIFAEFCARSYYKEMYEFSKADISNIYSEIKAVAEGKVAGDYKDFIYDLTRNVCLMYEEGETYYFIHRSFQEYYCALYFSRQKDKTMDGISSFFENRGLFQESDLTFDMLYGMIPEKVDEFIFLKYLDNVFTDNEPNYPDFLLHIYPTIIYWDKTIPITDSLDNVSRSFIYKKMCMLKGIQHESVREALFKIDRDVLVSTGNNAGSVQEWVFADERYKDEKWLKDHIDEKHVSNDDIKITTDRIPDHYYYIFGEPKRSAGLQLEIEIKKAFEHEELNEMFISAICDDSFPLKKEYRSVCEQYKQLKHYREVPTSSEDFFSQFN